MVKNLSASLKGSASAFQDKKKELLVHETNVATNVATGFGGGKSSSPPFQNQVGQLSAAHDTSLHQFLYLFY